MQINAPLVIESGLQGGFKEEVPITHSLAFESISQQSESTRIEPNTETEDQSTVIPVLGDQLNYSNGPVQLGEIQIPGDLDLFLKETIEQNQQVIAIEIPDDVKPSYENTSPTNYSNGPVQLGEIQIPDDLDLFLKDNVQLNQPVIEAKLSEDLTPPVENIPRLNHFNGSVQLGGIQIPDDLDVLLKDSVQHNQLVIETLVPEDTNPSPKTTPQPNYSNGSVQLGGIQIPDDLDLFLKDGVQQNQPAIEAKASEDVTPPVENISQTNYSSGPVQLGGIQFPDDLDLFLKDSIQQSQSIVEVKVPGDVEPSSEDTLQSRFINEESQAGTEISRNPEPSYRDSSQRPDNMVVPTNQEPSAEDIFQPRFMKEKDLLAIIKILKDVEPSSENHFPSFFAEENSEMITPVPEDVELLTEGQFESRRIKFPEDLEFSTQVYFPSVSETESLQDIEPLADTFQPQIVAKEDPSEVTEASENIEATLHPDLMMEETQFTRQQIYNLDSIQPIAKSPQIVNDQAINSSNIPKS